MPTDLFANVVIILWLITVAALVALVIGLGFDLISRPNR